jgi:hypothetical protein
MGGTGTGFAGPTFKFMKPLDFGWKLNRIEVEGRYQEVVDVFNRIKQKEDKKPAILKIFKRLGKQDCEILGECTGILLPLSLQEPVQRRESAMVTPESCGALVMGIAEFLSKYNNTGVKNLGPAPILE